MVCLWLCFVRDQALKAVYATKLPSTKEVVSRWGWASARSAWAGRRRCTDDAANRYCCPRGALCCLNGSSRWPDWRSRCTSHQRCAPVRRPPCASHCPANPPCFFPSTPVSECWRAPCHRLQKKVNMSSVSWCAKEGKNEWNGGLLRGLWLAFSSEPIRELVFQVNFCDSIFLSPPAKWKNRMKKRE